MGEEIMKFKKIMFVGIVLLAIFAIGAVSASDVNDTAIASDDINANEEILTVNNEISDDRKEEIKKAFNISEMVAGLLKPAQWKQFHAQLKSIENK